MRRRGWGTRLVSAPGAGELPNWSLLGLGFAGEGDAGDALEVGEEFDGVPGSEEGGEGVALAEAELEGEKAGGLEQGVGLGEKAGVELEAGGAGEEGLRGLVGADLGVERGGIGIGDVGRVRDDGVEGGLGGELLEEVGLKKVDAGGEVVGGGVLAGESEGFGGEVKRGDQGVGECVSESEGDGSGAGADVGKGEGCGGRQAGEVGLEGELGCGAGDEDGGGDAEGEAEKLLGAENVLEGLKAETLLEQALVAGLLLAVEGALGVGDEAGAGEGEGVAEEQDGVRQGGGLERGVGGELAGGAGEGFADGDHGQCCSRTSWLPSGSSKATASSNFWSLMCS